MAYFEGITPTDIELYNSSGLGNKISIWLAEAVSLFSMAPNLYGYTPSEDTLKALDERKAFLDAMKKAYENFKNSYPECKCGFGEFRRACMYKNK
jgi:hypothetical protein